MFKLQDKDKDNGDSLFKSASKKKLSSELLRIDGNLTIIMAPVIFLGERNRRIWIGKKNHLPSSILAE